jgi:glycosyltransferase involved in cell wall biosynthesis
MSTEAISVVIPCYNGARFLRDTLESVLVQTLPPREVLVVDDGSTDDSAAIAKSYGPPVRVIRQPNQGESVARNRGLEEAKGDWVAFLDADDLWLPEKLAEQAKHISDQVGAVCSGTIIRHPDGREEIHVPRPEFFQRRRIVEHGAPCHISTFVVRRDLPVTFPTWTAWSEDVIYYLDLLGHTQVAVADGPLVVYRIHPGAQTAKPGTRERQDASFRQWLALNRERMPANELAGLSAALQRREKYSLLSRALLHRRERRPLAALGLYTRVLFRSLFTPSSIPIVHTGARSFLGAVAEAAGVRQHPV